MFLSVCDIFKIGIGPSSSHTMGPMTAAARFLESLKAADLPGREAVRLQVRLHGSLAFTGKGHATDSAVILGLCGLTPDSLNPDEAESIEARVQETATVSPPGLAPMHFAPARDLVFDYGPPLPGHANGLVIQARDEDARDEDAPDKNGSILLERTYYSVGGGFVLTEQELQELGKTGEVSTGQEGDARPGYPYPFETAQQMLDMASEAGLSIAEMKRTNELACHHDRLDEKLDAIWQAMDSCIERGLRMEGILPGGLNVRRRAKAIHSQLTAERGRNTDQPHVANDWLSVYAIAVNEENAAGGRVVTSPTNGAAGVVPAVVRYYRDHCIGASHQGIRDFLLTAAAIGGLIKHNASISGAEVGCQGEVGSASAMAAAGLCAALGGTNEQVENDAEIALEHHLGMTCDPAAGLVQVPCIERNALGAIKAVSAASLSLRGDGRHFMPLDNCIKVMMETGRDMNAKYKETSTGGIAVNLAEC